MRTRHTVSLALVSFVGLMASTAVAADTAPVAQNVTSASRVLQVASGATRGRLDGDVRLRYPGFEQTTVVATKGHIVLITMESVYDKNAQGQQINAPVQGACSSYQLRADGPPVLVADLKRLSNYTRGERAFNHPKAAADEHGNIVYMYGSDSMNTEQNQPDTYAGIINERCEILAAPQMVSVRRNANDGAPDISYLGNGKFLAGYYSDGGNGTGFGATIGQPIAPAAITAGGDYSVALGLSIDTSGVLPTLKRDWITAIVTPTNIGRPTLTTVSGDRGLFCAPKGPNRPTDYITCGMIDTNTGTVVWQADVLKGDRQKRIYYNQPSIVKLAENRFALLAIESVRRGDQGQTKDLKGANTTHMLMLERNGDAITVGNEIVGASAHQTHASLCAGGYGEAGVPTIAVFSASPTGVGRAAMAMVNFDEASKNWSYDPKADLWPAAWYGDSGHLANMYGRNPMRQGRDYMRCIGDVQNPGYGVPNGFMADVKSFFVAPVHGRVPGDAKNSLFLSLVPGQMDKKAAPENPVVAGENPTLEPVDPNLGGADAGEKAGGCGCSTPGTAPTNTAAALAGLVAFGAIVSRRRRTSR